MNLIISNIYNCKTSITKFTPLITNSCSLVYDIFSLYRHFIVLLWEPSNLRFSAAIKDSHCYCCIFKLTLAKLKMCTNQPNCYSY